MPLKISFLLLFISLFVSCTNSAQNNQGFEKQSQDTNLVKSLEDSLIVLSINRKVYGVDDIKLEDIADCNNQNEKSVTFIDKRIEDLIGPTLNRLLSDQGFEISPKYYLYRVFKKEKEIEVWAGKSSTDSLKLIQTLRICAMDFEPGPKARQGDGKTPEGFYRLSDLYGSTNWFMWIRLNTGDIDNYGEVGIGSSFKLYVNYPNSLDRSRTAKYLPGKNSGGDICVHGNCVSAGCIAFKNRVFLPVYAFFKKHDRSRYGYPQIHVFPYRFEDYDIQKFSEENPDLPAEYLIEFWKNLKEGYDKFNSSHRAPKISIANNRYVFG